MHSQEERTSEQQEGGEEYVVRKATRLIPLKVHAGLKADPACQLCGGLR